MPREPPNTTWNDIKLFNFISSIPDRRINKSIRRKHKMPGRKSNPIAKMLDTIRSLESQLVEFQTQYEKEQINVEAALVYKPLIDKIRQIEPIITPETSTEEIIRPTIGETTQEAKTRTRRIKEQTEKDEKDKTSSSDNDDKEKTSIKDSESPEITNEPGQT